MCFTAAPPPTQSPPQSHPCQSRNMCVCYSWVQGATLRQVVSEHTPWKKMAHAQQPRMRFFCDWKKCYFFTGKDSTMVDLKMPAQCDAKQVWLTFRTRNTTKQVIQHVGNLELSHSHHGRCVFPILLPCTSDLSQRKVWHNTWKSVTHDDWVDGNTEHRLAQTQQERL